MNNHHNYDFPLLTAALGFFASFLNSATQAKQYFPTWGEIFHDLVLAAFCAAIGFGMNLLMNYIKDKTKKS